MEILQDIVTAARNLRADLKLDPKAALTGQLYARAAAADVCASQSEVIEKLAGVKLELCEGPAPRCCSTSNPARCVRWR